MRGFGRLVAVLAMSAGVPVAAQAGAIIQTYAIPSGFNGTTPLVTTSNTLPLAITTFSFFDYQSAPGYVAGTTLTAVKLSISGTSVQTIAVSNTSGADQTANKISGDGFIRVYKNATATGGAALNATFNNTYLDATNGDTPLTIAATDHSVTNYGATTSVSAGPLAQTIAPFDTTGSFTWSWTSFGEQTNSGGNLSYNTITQVGGLITLEYDYTDPPVTPMPEPLSLALLGTGVLGMGLLRRRVQI